MPYTILLVDDDRDFRREFRSFFEDYRIREASCGAEALDILKHPHEIDLVLLDVRLPDVRGTEILREIKRLEPALAVVILTGYGSKEVVLGALQGNADDYVEKPLDLKRTKAIIEKLLEKAEWAGGVRSSDAASVARRVKSFLERNCHKKVSLADAAAAVCLSPKYLSRLFRQTAGRGFNDYKLAVKMAKAKEWLRTPAHTVNKIAISLGYQNTESFIRMFEKATGYSPNAYRRTLLRRASSGRKISRGRGKGRRRERHLALPTPIRFLR